MVERSSRMQGTIGENGQPVPADGAERESSRSPSASIGNTGRQFYRCLPFLVISEASLADLNRRLEKPIPMNRLRPNIVIGGELNSYAEDQWQSIEIGSLRFRHGPPCVRCVVTTTDQITLERGKEPLNTLATYRRNDDGGVNFGMNFFCESSTGTIQVGDVIRLLPNEMTNAT